nr:MAG TPA: hypothetical protein [Crassvirales sp.]
MRGVEPLYCHLLIINFYMLFVITHIGLNEFQHPPPYLNKAKNKEKADKLYKLKLSLLCSLVSD